MNLQMHMYNRQMTDKWLMQAAEMQHYVRVLVTKDPQGETVNMFANSVDGLDSIIEDLETLLNSLRHARQSRDNHGNLTVQK